MLWKWLSILQENWVYPDQMQQREVFYENCVPKKFAKFTANSQNNSVGVSFLVKWKLLNWCFFCEFCEIFQTTFSTEHLWATTSVWLSQMILRSNFRIYRFNNIGNCPLMRQMYWKKLKRATSTTLTIGLFHW